MKVNAKLAIRVAVLVVAMVGTFIAGNFQPVSAADGGPLILCPPRQQVARAPCPRSANQVLSENRVLG